MKGIAFIVLLLGSTFACGGGAPTRRIVIFTNDYADRFYRAKEKDVCQSICGKAKHPNERVVQCYEATLDPSLKELTPEDRKEAIVCKLE